MFARGRMHYFLFVLVLCVTGPAGSQPLNNPFAAPGVMEKLANDSRTKDFLKDPSYMALLKMLQIDSSAMGK